MVCIVVVLTTKVGSIADPTLSPSVSIPERKGRNVVQFLCHPVTIVLTAIFMACLLGTYLFNKRSDRKRYHRYRGPEPDFSAFEGDLDGDLVSLTVAKPTDSASFDRHGDDSDLLYAEHYYDDRRAPGGDPDLLQDDEGPEYTSIVEPSPIFGTRVTVRQSFMRAARHMERCAEAVHDRHDFAEAEAFALAALHEINDTMKRDHWYAPFVLNWLGYLRYEQGFAVEARDHWEKAEQIAIEWFEQCHELLPEIRNNLKFFHDQLGF